MERRHVALVFLD